MMSNTISAFSSLGMFSEKPYPGRAQKGAGGLGHSANWRGAVKRRLMELTALPIGWDGYRGLPVKSENAIFALTILGVICENYTSAPQIVPGIDGDLQIEWHTATGDVELHIIAPNNVQAWYSIAQENDDGVSCEVRSDFKTVAIWVKEVVGDEIAAEPAAA